MGYNLFSSIMFVSLLFVGSSYAIPVGELNDICKKTKNPSFCLTLLNPKQNADLVGLTQYTIDITRENVTNSIKFIEKLIAQSEKDPKAKNHYKECLEEFGPEEGALSEVDYAQELLKKGDYSGVNTAASGILGYVDDCVSGQSPSDPPFNDPSQLPQYVAIIESLADIILVLSQSLAAPH